MPSTVTVIGFDFGHKRIGIATGNTVTETAQPLTTLKSGRNGPDWNAIDKMIDEWKPRKLIVGLPLSMSGEETVMSGQARKFGALLKTRTSIDVVFVDERLSSSEADHMIRNLTPDKKKIRKKHLSMRDNLAAQLILETYFEDNQGMKCAIEIEPLINTMAQQITADKIINPAIIGIHTGGVWVARQLHQALSIDEPLGSLDISFYRDDFSQVGLNPEVRSSELPMEIENRNIILIDDVLYTGRTIRAALNEIFSYGRPSMVKLGVLVNRAGRELPIQPDYIGETMDLDHSQQAKLSIENNKLSLSIVNTGENSR